MGGREEDGDKKRMKFGRSENRRSMRRESMRSENGRRWTFSKMRGRVNGIPCETKTAQIWQK